MHANGAEIEQPNDSNVGVLALDITISKIDRTDDRKALKKASSKGRKWHFSVGNMPGPSSSSLLPPLTQKSCT